MPQKKDRTPKKKKAKHIAPGRHLARYLSAVAVALWLVLCLTGLWFVRHPAPWLAARREALPAILFRPLMYFGDHTAFFTDALGWTGHDAIYDFDEEPPAGRVFFAGEPKRVGQPAPSDIVILRRGEFVIGWSPSLRHPVWAAYHVPREKRFDPPPRPNFQRDRNVASSPAANAYGRTGYDRGHMVPNYAIATRFGPEEQRKTFLMTNIAPQTPSLNRGPWREIEHRIADLWTARYGEIWVIIGTVPGPHPHSRQTLSGTQIDVPEQFFALLATQTDEGVRALALVLPQEIDFDAFPVHNIVTIDELEAQTGFDFFPDLPEFIQRPLEADRPTRLWPVRWFDVVKLILLRFC